MLDEAQEILEALAADWPTYHYHMACCLALRIPPASASRNPHAVEDGRRYGDRAMVELRRAVAGGFKPSKITGPTPTWTRSASARTSRHLLMDLAFPADPFAP